ncbi:MAG: rod shape-determining protein MreC [Actinomycetota bacterium]|nr:rod shape-determining protein MreC [Acidimicrobiales bacterium]MED5173738.1 rod shape-determining protein MreC [Actinomycetota bacterium]
MLRRSTSRRSRSSQFRLALLVLTSLVLITLDARTEGGAIDTARGAVLDVLGPLRSNTAKIFEPIGEAWEAVTSYDELEAHNALLRAKLTEIQNSVLEVGEIERERESLLALLGARDRVAHVGRRTARVIDAPVSNYQRTLELDKGSRDGITVGMPVETGAGVIGRISNVSVTRSQVELLTDPNFDVGVRMVRSGDDGIASGRGHNEDLEVSFIELDTVVIPGETVVTSGFQGSTFPEGLLIGTVVDVVPNAVQGTQRITIHPAADLDRLRWVQVLLFDPDAPEPVVVDRVPENDAAETESEESTP